MDNEKLQNLRHSLAHLLAAAVMEIWPDAKRTIGPAIENGFYYDFEFSKPVSDTDLPKIEKKMREIIKTWDTFVKIEYSKEEAKKQYPDNPYKHELIDEFSQDGNMLSFFKSGNYEDLCKGGHIESMKDVDPKSFKLTHLAGAYWRGDEKNKMLTRIYGLAFQTQGDLEAYVKKMEEAEKRDHRKLGKELKLFTFSDLVGSGLPLWLPKGATVRRILERYVIDEEIRRGYQHVTTPDIAHLNLYRKSGHYPYYKESMYAPIEIDGDEYMLRPMTCPHHFQIYDNEQRSYRELPMRIAEIAKLYRYEQSGELSGLMRVRSFCLADAHIICADMKQASQEICNALDLIEDMASVFGLKMGENYWYRLSLGDRNNEEKYYKNDQAWNDGEKLLRDLLNDRKAQFVEAPDEAAFYGPKIDVQMKNVRGKEDTAFTVQYDFCMPDRFELEYVDADGKKKRPLVIHRSSVGAIERVLAFLIEHFAGAFPLWLSPVQVAILPISDKHIDKAKEVESQLAQRGLRVEVDEASETIGKKIREAELQKIPYLLILGDKEIDTNKIALRQRGKGDIGQMDLEDFISKLTDEVSKKTL